MKKCDFCQHVGSDIGPYLFQLWTGSVIWGDVETSHPSALSALQGGGCIALPWGAQTLPPGLASAPGMLQNSLTLLGTAIPCLNHPGKSALLRCRHASPGSAGRIGSPRAAGRS